LFPASGAVMGCNSFFESIFMSLTIKGLYPMRGGKRVSVVLSDRRRLSLTNGKVQALRLKVGEDVPPTLLSVLAERFTPEAARNTASRWCMMRPMFSFEVEKKLSEKGFSSDISHDVLEWLIRLGAIDDAETLRRFLSAGEAKGKGQKMLLQELIRRGMPRQDAEEALSDNASGSDEGALRLLTRRLKGSTDREDLRKAAAFLYRRGFDREKIAFLMKEYLQNRNEDS